MTYMLRFHDVNRRSHLCIQQARIQTVHNVSRLNKNMYPKYANDMWVANFFALFNKTFWYLILFWHFCMHCARWLITRRLDAPWCISAYVTLDNIAYIKNRKDYIFLPIWNMCGWDLAPPWSPSRPIMWHVRGQTKSQNGIMTDC